MHLFRLVTDRLIDVHDAARDEKLAQYVMNVHTGATQDEDKGEELDLETLKKWVQFKSANINI